MNDTLILIITYNSAQEIAPCLEAAIRTGAQVLVIDNASADSTAEIVRLFPVALIVNPSNRGFAGAVNQGVRGTNCAYILLLNPDAVLITGVGILRRLLSRPEVGATAGILTDPAGEPQAGFTVRCLPTPLALSFEVLGLNRALPTNPVNWWFRCLGMRLDNASPIPVEQPAGAFFMFSRSCWEVLGGFDEQFHPLWFEDVDFCARLAQHGKTILLAPEVRAKHTGAHSILNMALEIRKIYWYGNLLRYTSKHFSPAGRQFVCASVILGAGLRYMGDVLSGGKGYTQAAVWSQVAMLAVRCSIGAPSSR